ncbi:MAG: TonB-dependent receptor [Xanthomonadales bacterium]|nr:TonB-dependent receptor [Xanthomonadales bacterium]
MKRLSQSKLPLAVAISAALTMPVYAQDDSSQRAENQIIEEVITTGSRSSKPRTATDSPVPVDVIKGDDFLALGNTADLTDNLKAYVPSYTASPATGDGSAFVRPTSLRGMSPDQVLVLVNGKRRHRSALVHFFAPAAGNGAHGPDIGMIPGIAIQNVEILRDGAASQYGSDAISGVINFITKRYDSGGQVQLQYGQHYDGEDSLKVAANMGFAAGDNGFVNISIDHTDNDALSRGIQRPDAQALIDSGVQGVGADAPFGDAPLAQTWGRPETSGTRLFINSGFELDNGSELYFFGNYAQTEGRYRFFYRNPGHPTIAALNELGFTGLLAGYTPFLDGDQDDLSIVGGLTGAFDNGVDYDFSVGYGSNELDYFLNNTLNQSLGLVGGQPAQRDFDTGGYEQSELNLNADFSYAWRENVNVAFGAEWREETYEAIAGEPNSYLGAGSNGLGGTKPQDAGEFDRDNFGIYTDIEHDISDRWLMQYALRYEDFSDFGSTVNGKVATRVNVGEATALRGAISTGFHAPTPGQANVRTTITTFDGATGLQVEEGLVPSTSPLVAAVGGTALKEEESLNISAGFTTDIGDRTTLTVDFYSVEVDDRIYRTGDITVPGQDGTISFYTNALDVEHQGVDVVVTSGFDWGDSEVNTDMILAFNHNTIDVTGQTQVGGVNPVSESLIEDIENNYPDNRWSLTANTEFNSQWNLMLRANFYGEHFDERGRIGAAENPSAEIDSTVYLDMEVGYQYNDNLRLVLGGSNIFDEFVDEIGPPNSNRLSVGLQYPRRTVANYEGGSWYLRAEWSFD